MMNVQRVNCQPIKPTYTAPSFAGRYDYAIEDMRREKDEWAVIADNKDSKFISTLGTLGVGALAGAISFATFKTVAPKGFQTLKSICKKVVNNKFVKRSVEFGKKGYNKIKTGLINQLNKIKPDSKLGKTKAWIAKKYNWLASKIKPLARKIYLNIRWFAHKHGIDKATMKEAGMNVAATGVAIPAAVTAVNADLGKEECYDC